VRKASSTPSMFNFDAGKERSVTRTDRSEAEGLLVGSMVVLVNASV